jgi:hypothetical protein
MVRRGKTSRLKGMKLVRLEENHLAAFEQVFLAANGDYHLTLVDVVEFPEIVALAAENEVRRVLKIQYRNYTAYEYFLFIRLSYKAVRHITHPFSVQLCKHQG